MARAENSRHLAELMVNRSGTVDAQVVFLDIVSYSNRKSTVQKQVVERFQNDLKETVVEVGRQSLEYIQANDVNFGTDVVIIPTGDGAALSFTFGGLHSVGLDFSRFFQNAYITGYPLHPANASQNRAGVTVIHTTLFG